MVYNLLCKKAYEFFWSTAFFENAAFARTTNRQKPILRKQTNKQTNKQQQQQQQQQLQQQNTPAISPPPSQHTKGDATYLHALRRRSDDGER